VASLASTFTVRHTHSRTAGIVVGALTGAGTAAAMAGFSGTPGIAMAVGGALLGGLMSLRGDRKSQVRDAAGGATMITGLFLPGTIKIAGAVAAGLGASCEKPWQQAAVGAAVGAGLGFALGAAGIAPGGPIAAAAISGIGGAVGPFFGPRFSQFFRNLANDSGKVAVGGLRKLGVDDSKISEKTANSLGAFPAQFGKEAIRSFINSDHSITAVLAGGLMESIELVHIFWNQKGAKDTPAAPPATPPGQPAPPPTTQSSKAAA